MFDMDASDPTLAIPPSPPVAAPPHEIIIVETEREKQQCFDVVMCLKVPRFFFN